MLFRHYRPGGPHLRRLWKNRGRLHPRGGPGGTKGGGVGGRQGLAPGEAVMLAGGEGEDGVGVLHEDGHLVDARVARAAARAEPSSTYSSIIFRRT